MCNRIIIIYIYIYNIITYSVYVLIREQSNVGSVSSLFEPLESKRRIDLFDIIER